MTAGLGVICAAALAVAALVVLGGVVLFAVTIATVAGVLFLAVRAIMAGPYG